MSFRFKIDFFLSTRNCTKGMYIGSWYKLNFDRCQNYTKTIEANSSTISFYDCTNFHRLVTRREGEKLFRGRERERKEGRKENVGPGDTFGAARRRWRGRRAKKIHVILEWFARAECSARFTALYWAPVGSTSPEQGRSWLNPKATSTLLLAAPKRAYCATNSQKRRSARLHRSLH